MIRAVENVHRQHLKRLIEQNPHQSVKEMSQIMGAFDFNNIRPSQEHCQDEET